MHRSRLAALLLFAALAIPLWAADSPDDSDRNARLLEKWKSDPEHYARLKRDWNQFHALPAERQEKLRQFDRDLHECDSETQKRLWETLEHYAAWLDQLPETEQQQILAIVDKTERLKAIKQKREQQWLERLPAKDRETLQNTPPEQRPAAIARMRKDDHQRREQWLLALKLRPDLRPRPNHPKKLEDFPPEVVEFVNDLLTPMLHDKEKDQLKSAQDWPALAQAILEMAEKHPVLPPIGSKDPLVSFAKLSKNDQLALGKSKGGLSKHEGRWPEFALAVTEQAARNNHVLTRPLGASKPSEFSPEVQEFLEKQLLPTITEVEKERLRLTEGKWPTYPKLLLDLAKKYNLVIPGMSLPGPRELWEDAHMASLPEVPDHTLREFIHELSSEDLQKLNLSVTDPSSRNRLRQAYFQQRPGELKRLHEQDQHKGDARRKPPGP